MDLAICFALALIVLPLYVFVMKRRYKRVPPGSLGLPIIGQSLDLLRTMRTNTAEQCLQERTKRYGSIWKLRIFGTATQGQVANKFIYTCDGSLLSNKQPTSIRRLLDGGDDHKRIRGALLSFLKPEALKQNVKKMDEEIRLHLEMYWQWHGKVEVKRLAGTGDNYLLLLWALSGPHGMCSVVTSKDFDLQQTGLAFIWNGKGSKKREIIELFQILMDGMLTFPINLPFTRFSHSIKAHTKIKNIAALEQQVSSINQDLITCILSLRNEDNSAALTDEEILDNCIITMVAGHDPSSILITFLFRLFAGDPSVYAAVVEGKNFLSL
ncbi:LOW QUALITY PROTEIN: Cytochrome P450 [Dillenia turbinata]|uniref:Cytochrome P450 n=1 Tax=Dillenia turbinata TaxID=194707 RepID=A0AAN8VS16_9MAGN